MQMFFSFLGFFEIQKKVKLLHFCICVTPAVNGTWPLPSWADSSHKASGLSAVPTPRDSATCRWAAAAWCECLERMGARSSKVNAVTPEPTSTTVTVHTTVYTSAADFKGSEVKCRLDNHQILYISLAFISGVLVAVLVFALICLFRKKHKRSHQSLQEQVPLPTVTEESAKNTQTEVAYTTLVFQQSKAPAAV